MNKFLPVMAGAGLLVLSGCTQNEPSRTFQSGSFHCTEDGASTVVDGAALADVLEKAGEAAEKTGDAFEKAGNIFQTSTISSDFTGSSIVGGSMTKENADILEELLEACRRFIDGEAPPPKPSARVEGTQ